MRVVVRCSSSPRSGLPGRPSRVSGGRARVRLRSGGGWRASAWAAVWTLRPQHQHDDGDTDGDALPLPFVSGGRRPDLAVPACPLRLPLDPPLSDPAPRLGVGDHGSENTHARVASSPGRLGQNPPPFTAGPPPPQGLLLAAAGARHRSPVTVRRAAAGRFVLLCATSAAENGAAAPAFVSGGPRPDLPSLSTDPPSHSLDPSPRQRLVPALRPPTSNTTPHPHLWGSRPAAQPASGWADPATPRPDLQSPRATELPRPPSPLSFPVRGVRPCGFQCVDLPAAGA